MVSLVLKQGGTDRVHPQSYGAQKSPVSIALSIAIKKHASNTPLPILQNSRKHKGKPDIFCNLISYCRETHVTDTFDLFSLTF